MSTSSVATNPTHQRLKFKQFMKEFETRHNKCWEAAIGRFKCNAVEKYLDPEAHMCFCNAMKTPQNYVRFMSCFHTLLSEATKKAEEKEAVSKVEQSFWHDTDSDDIAFCKVCERRVHCDDNLLCKKCAPADSPFRRPQKKRVDCAMCAALGRACSSHEHAVIEKQVDSVAWKTGELNLFEKCEITNEGTPIEWTDHCKENPLTYCENHNIEDDCEPSN